VSRTDFGRPGSFLSLLGSIGTGLRPVARGRVVLGTLTGARWAADVQRAVCEVAALLGERLGMPEAVRASLGESFERWDGKGQPRGLRGEEIAVPGRIAQVAAQAVACHRLGGIERAAAEVRASSGGWFDPVVAEVFERHGRELLLELEASDVLEAAVACEPRPRRTVRGAQVDEVARVFAEMADLKSTFTPGHSAEVARLVTEAAPRCGLNGEATAEVRVAALLHDIGRVGVPAGTWERRGTLGSAEWERMRLHPYYTERILARTRLGAVAGIAGRHHERLDGSGYHRGSGAADQPAAARLLAAADMFQTKTQARPHRAALPAEAAAELLTEEARAGRLDREAVAAVVEAASGAEATRRVPGPAGLTPREVEVLRLVAAGHSNPAIAERLSISRRTAEHHVQHIYEKIGLSTRAGATVFAMQHDLLRPSQLS
jgi:HD-GYP domain-containing protein (c-di-GMP phosphodiesterase class II)